MNIIALEYSAAGSELEFSLVQGIVSDNSRERFFLVDDDGELHSISDSHALRLASSLFSVEGSHFAWEPGQVVCVFGCDFMASLRLIARFAGSVEAAQLLALPIGPAGVRLLVASKDHTFAILRLLAEQLEDFLDVRMARGSVDVELAYFVFDLYEQMPSASAHDRLARGLFLANIAGDERTATRLRRDYELFEGVSARAATEAVALYGESLKPRAQGASPVVGVGQRLNNYIYSSMLELRGEVAAVNSRVDNVVAEVVLGRIEAAFPGLSNKVLSVDTSEEVQNV